MALVKLKSPGHISVGGELYVLAKDGTIEVPEEHAPHLVESHGCKYVEASKGKDSKKGDAE